MLLLNFLLALVACQVEVLNQKDLAADSTFLVFLYYERPNFNCPACKHYMHVLEELEVPVKTCNFAEDIRLGSRFLRYSFPAFILRNNKRSYILDPVNRDELLHLTTGERWREVKEVKRVLSALEVDSLIVRLFCVINPIIFAVIRNLYFIVDNIPEKLIAFFVVCIITYLIYSIFEIFMEPDPKIKIE